MHGHCTGVGWSEGSLSFELRDRDEKSQRELRSGDELAIELVGSRQCIGYRPPEGGSLLACPGGADNLSSAQCPDCFEQARILPCLRCTGDRCNNPVRRKSCVVPENHAVYLASFGPGVVKVGVARWERRYERLAEQGARAAIVIARDDGQQVRRMESQYRSFIDGVEDRLSPTEKLTAYTLAGSPEKLRKELAEVFDLSKIRVLGQWLNTPEPVELPLLPVLPTAPRLLRPGAGFRLRGTVFALCGQAIIIDSDTGERVALEASSLAGYELRALHTSEQGEGQLTMALV